MTPEQWKNRKKIKKTSTTLGFYVGGHFIVTSEIESLSQSLSVNKTTKNPTYYINIHMKSGKTIEHTTPLTQKFKTITVKYWFRPAEERVVPLDTPQEYFDNAESKAEQEEHYLRVKNKLASYLRDGIRNKSGEVFKFKPKS